MSQCSNSNTRLFIHIKNLILCIYVSLLCWYRHLILVDIILVEDSFQSYLEAPKGLFSVTSNGIEEKICKKKKRIIIERCSVYFPYPYGIINIFCNSSCSYITMEDMITEKVK